MSEPSYRVVLTSEERDVLHAMIRYSLGDLGADQLYVPEDVLESARAALERAQEVTGE